MKIETKYGPYIHGVDLTENLDQIANKLLTAKEIGVTYIYDLQGVVGLNWNPKARFLFNDSVNSVDDVYMFITGMSRDEYKSCLKEEIKNIKR
jgi:hypothetical protein